MKGLPTMIVLLFTVCTYAGNEAGDDNDAKVTNAYGGVMQDRTANSEAEAMYVEKCSMCHRRMGMGTLLLARRLGPEHAMLEQRKDLNRELIEFAARNGIGNMPPISRGEVSDEQLDIIIDWLTHQEQNRELE
jgi:cytochrome c5